MRDLDDYTQSIAGYRRKGLAVVAYVTHLVQSFGGLDLTQTSLYNIIASSQVFTAIALGVIGLAWLHLGDKGDARMPELPTLDEELERVGDIGEAYDE